MTGPDFPMSDAAVAADLITMRRSDGGTAHPGVVVLAPVGELDQVSASAVWAPLAEQLVAGHHVVLDLSGIEFFASVGVKILMAACARARDVGAALVIVAAGAVVRRPLELLGVLDQLPIYAEREYALGVCARQPTS
ncbi:MAG TPA: STAS domain-containing protein [Pseudonocardiaceae bacterium]|jgi:anti-sigma B factor antagonist